MFFLKKLIFKFMELGLGLRTCFSLETKNPIFVNFKLTDEEATKLQKSLPKGVTLQKIRFSQNDVSSDYWISYNLYEIRYPKKELQKIRKVRCEINTFVTDAAGRKGVYVFCGSPYVSKEKMKSLIGTVCDFAERMVMFIYGCGRLIGLTYELGDRNLKIEFQDGSSRFFLKHDIEAPYNDTEQLSDEYWIYNDISFFNGARTYDLVNVNSAFYAAKFQKIEGATLNHFELEAPYFGRRPDRVYFHRGEISYMVNSMNRACMA